MRVNPGCPRFFWVWLLLLIGVCSGGCSQLSKRDLGSAAADAFRSRDVWIPLAMAAVTGGTELDREISAWAATEHPVFGSGDNASQFSDRMYTALPITALLSNAIPPSEADSPTHRLILDLGTFGVTQGVVKLAKTGFRRERPNQRNKRSLPSGHTSRVVTSANIIRRNMQRSNLSPLIKTSVPILTYSLAGLTGWARIESEAHYPSDVLVGAALGNFISHVANDVFGQDARSYLQAQPIENGFHISLYRSF